MFKRWWDNQWERNRRFKNKEDENIFTKCPNCSNMKDVKAKPSYSWWIFLVGLILVLLTVFVSWNNFMFLLGLILAGYQSMKMISSTANGDKHICYNCNHEWIGKGYGKNHKVVG